MLALLIPGVGMGGGNAVSLAPVAVRTIWLTIEDRLLVTLSHENELALTLHHDPYLAITLTDQSHAR